MSHPKDEYQKLIWGDVYIILLHFVKLALSRKDIADKFHPNLFDYLKQFRKGWQTTIQQSFRSLYRTLATRKLKLGYGKKENVLKEVIYDVVINIPRTFKSAVDKFSHNDQVIRAIDTWDEKEYLFDYQLKWYEEIRKFLSTGLLVKNNTLPEYDMILKRLNDFIKKFLGNDIYLTEMSNLRTVDSGLSTGTLYVSAKEGNHGPRVKYYRGGPGQNRPSASISVSKTPLVVEDSLKSPIKVQEQKEVKAFIIKNYLKLKVIWDTGLGLYKDEWDKLINALEPITKEDLKNILDEIEMKPYEKQSFKEMAYAGTVKGLVIEVWTDHNPPHFHVIKKESFNVRIAINNNKVISYKWQVSGKEINAQELKAIKIWLDQPSIKNHQITNHEKIIILWDALNSK